MEYIIAILLPPVALVAYAWWRAGKQDQSAALHGADDRLASGKAIRY